MADQDTGWEPDPKDVERRKNELLAEARGERSGDGPNAMVGLGLQFVVTVLVCLFAGQWLDRRLGTTPWLLLSGVLLGGGLGMWTMLRVAKEQEKRQGGK
jgi:ATP synthase protein I